jgi:hypothetical protein
LAAKAAGNESVDGCMMVCKKRNGRQCNNQPNKGVVKVGGGCGGDGDSDDSGDDGDNVGSKDNSGNSKYDDNDDEDDDDNDDNDNDDNDNNVNTEKDGVGGGLAAATAAVGAAVDNCGGGKSSRK